MNDVALFFAVFLACIVEAVEATTIVLAAGTARHWRSALLGVLAGLAVLVVAIAIAGPAISLLPIGILRLVVGGLLLVFGLQWMRKAILRASGYKPLHDETAIYEREVAAAAKAEAGARRGVQDWYAFTLSFKGVVLEGLEVVFIVLTFGTNQQNLPVAAIAAGVAVVIVVILGIAVRGPLSRVPENTLKFVVGVMLTSFGIFWGAEGAGAVWPGEDAALLVIAPAIAIVALAMVAGMLRYRRSRAAAQQAVPVAVQVAEASARSDADMTAGPIDAAAESLPSLAPGASPTFGTRLLSFGAFWYDFIIGDDWQIAAGVALGFVLTFLLSLATPLAWIVMPIAVAILLPYGVRRAMKP
ncbi:hypothetical protein BH09ACT4_BH09ACT4_12570 [soil metagenome]